MLIYLYLRKSNMDQSRIGRFGADCQALLEVYAILPYSFDRSRKRLETYKRGPSETGDPAEESKAAE